MGLESLIITFFLIAQDSAPLTNSGEVFEDPFGGEPSVEETVPDQPSEPETEVVEESAQEAEDLPASQDFQDPFEGGSGPAASPPPPPDRELEPQALPPSPPANEQPEAPSVSPTITPPANSFEFPGFEDEESSVSQDVKRRQAAVSGTPVGTWHFSAKPGAGFNFNRRPTQVSFELEGGYRLFKDFDLNLLTNFRFVKDRMLGFIALPSYSFRISGRSVNRWDLRVGLGTGWILQGVSGAGFQYGYFPVRTDFQLTYYATSDFGIFLSTGTETLLYRIETGGGSTFNELSSTNGPPTQLLLHTGLRLEF